jgi:hypothetical protein
MTLVPVSDFFAILLSSAQELEKDVVLGQS